MVHRIVMLLPLMAKLQGVRLPQKIEKMHFIQLVHGVASTN